jgi:ABC-2 type transport system permease protein
MNTFYSLVRKDLYVSLSTPLAYILCAGYVFMSGFFFFSYIRAFNPFQKITSMTSDAGVSFNEGVIVPLYQAQLVLLLFIIPLVSMRAVSEEKTSGALEILLSTPTSVLTIVYAKWAYLMILLGGAVTIGLIFPITICSIGDPEIPPVLIGACGLYFFVGIISALGVFLSSISKSQTVAGILILLGALGWFMLDVPFTSQGDSLALFFKSVSLSLAAEEFFQGVLSLSNVYFFVASIVALLFLSQQVLSSQSGRL